MPPPIVPSVVGPAVAFTVIGRPIVYAPPVTSAAGFPPEFASPIVIALVASPNTPLAPEKALPPAISVPMVIDVAPE